MLRLGRVVPKKLFAGLYTPRKMFSATLFFLGLDQMSEICCCGLAAILLL